MEADLSLIQLDHQQAVLDLQHQVGKEVTK